MRCVTHQHSLPCRGVAMTISFVFYICVQHVGANVTVVGRIKGDRHAQMVRMQLDLAR